MKAKKEKKNVNEAVQDTEPCKGSAAVKMKPQIARPSIVRSSYIDSKL
jgi:hypothetical protein